MNNKGKLECIGLEEILSDNFKKFSLAELNPGQCCFVKIKFCALKPGKYAIRASFSYNEGRFKTLETRTVVEPKIEAKLRVTCVLVVYTLTRLSLAFKMGES
ncbi:MAG: hypothetical protein O7C59_06000 [Rickettsia endosymbiont of Ixodes persulcatus]|nr:hypothetical protein [Rickettsia endosymbiont of Ixodes persulcatus]